MTYDELISILTELVSSLPYGNWSIDERQKVYNDWLKRHEQQLKNITNDKCGNPTREIQPRVD